MTKNIISIGFSLPRKVFKQVDIFSDISLLDYDIVVFECTFLVESVQENYKGLPLLRESYSIQLKNAVDHWRTQLNDVFSSGKTVFLFLRKNEKVYIQTGNKQRAGKSNNSPLTNYVDLFEFYEFLPVTIGEIVSGTGKNVANNNKGVLSQYWKDFGSFSYYEAYFNSVFEGSLIKSKSLNKTIGGIFKVDKGWLVILPPLNLPVRKKSSITNWAGDPYKISRKLLTYFIGIDDNIRAGIQKTPPPEWIKSVEFDIEKATKIEGDADNLKTEIANLEMNLNAKINEIDNIYLAKRLLFEQGPQLEEAIIDCLNCMGFKAKSYSDSESEFDVVFESAEGRFLGEAEGKDNSAINIDKLSQLERNIQEDFAHDGITEYAQGVLFGNAYRLICIAERKEYFTSKCLSGARRSNIILIRTPDLYAVQKHIIDNPNDQEFKRLCREAIKISKGEIVKFPLPKEK